MNTKTVYVYKFDCEIPMLFETLEEMIAYYRFTKEEYAHECDEELDYEDLDKEVASVTKSLEQDSYAHSLDYDVYFYKCELTTKF